MNEEKMTDLVIRITSELSSLNTNMRTVLEKLTNHENRITNLEQGKCGVKDYIIKYLLIGLIGCISVIVTLTGAYSVFKFMLPVQ